MKFVDSSDHIHEIVEEIALSEEFYATNLEGESDRVAILYMLLLARNPDPRKINILKN